MSDTMTFFVAAFGIFGLGGYVGWVAHWTWGHDTLNGYDREDRRPMAKS